MIEIKYHSKRYNLLELRVRILIDRIAKQWDNLENFERAFKIEIEQIPQTNAIHPEQAYQLYYTKTKIDVWHHTPFNDPDRHICTITCNNI